MARRIGAAVILAGLALPAAGDTAGHVVQVADGDTLTVLVGGRERRQVRLAGIDAPERLQGFGRQAQNNLSTLTFGRDVRLEGEKRGGGHVVARIWVADPDCREPSCPKNVDVGLAQVAGGFAWSDAAPASGLPSEQRERYAQAEFQAKIRRLGLWGEARPQPPWEWRRHRPDE